MSPRDIIRAWKDQDYRDSLSEAERAALPEHPAGAAELTDADLAGVAGAAKGTQCACTHHCNPGPRPLPSTVICKTQVCKTFFCPIMR